jgi:hypothetical protein
MAGGSSPPVIGDPDAGQQPAVALVNRWPNEGEKDRCGRRGFPHDPRPPRRRRVQGRSPSGCKPKFISASLRLLVGAALAATLCVIENQGFGVYRSGFHCDPCAIEVGGSGRKPLLQRPSFCRSGFSRDLCAIESHRLGVTEWSSLRTLCDRRQNVLLQKPSFCRSGFSRDLCAIENLGFGVYRSGFHCDPCVIEGGGSGRKLLLQKPSFCRSGFSRDLCAIENLGFGVYRSGFHCDPCVIEGGGSGRKPLLQKPSFCRSGFSRDPCVIENQGFGVYRSVFRCDPCAIENEGSGRKIAALPLGGPEMGWRATAGSCPA